MSSGTAALLSGGTGLGLQVNSSKFQGVDMPLSRTRSLLSNINGTANGSLDSNNGGDSFLPHVIGDSHHGSHHHLPPLKGGPQSLVNSKPGYVGLDVGVGMIQRLLSNGSEDSSSSSMLPPTSNGSTTNGTTGNGSLNNYSHMSVSTTQIQSQSLPPTTIARPASADFTVGPPNPLSGDSNKMTPNRTKYKAVPASPEQVIKLYHSRLTPYEISEINSYPEVYFIGLGAKKRPGIVGSSNNNGYDDDQGSYIHVQHDHVGYRYEVLKVIGKGSFGQVVKAFDHKCNVHVALKMVRNEKRFHRQAQEEIRILEHLRDLDKDNNMNIIHMCDHFTFRNHTCITFELLSLNLYELIKKNKFQGFSLQLVRKFAHSLLQCLDALARNKIIHCDMKPENVLLKQQGRSGIKEKILKKDLTQQVNPPKYEKTEDMSNLTFLNDASVLYNLKQRYYNKLIYSLKMAGIRDTDSRGEGDFDLSLVESSQFMRSFNGADGDSFRTTITNPKSRQSNYQSTALEEDAFSSVNDLHNAFVGAIVNMPSRLQLFEVMDEWILYIEKALNVERHLDPDIPDHVYEQVQYVLKREYETWDLIKTLYYDRLTLEENEEPVPFDKAIYDKYHLDDMSYAEAIVRGDKSLQEMQTIIGWLELNFSRRGDPDLSEKYILWEQTLDALKRDKLLGKQSSSMVAHIDPDAPTREKKQLHPLDSDEELRVHRGTFHYLRIGQLEKAIAFLHESGHVAKAAALLGSCLSQKEPISQDDEMDEDFVVVSGTAQSLPKSSEYPPGSILQPRQQPDFIVTGNPERDLWKSIAWTICDQDGMSKWERAVIGVRCGHRQSILDVAQSWEDKLWAFLKTSVDVKIETKLRNLSVASDHMKLPSEYWSQGLTIAQILEKLESSEKQDFTIDYLFQILQKSVMLNDIEIFLTAMEENIETLLECFENPVILNHVVRFLTHVLLAFAIVELPYNERLTNCVCEAYIHVLVKSGLFACIPFYVQKLSFDLQIPVIINQINIEKQYTASEITNFLQAASDNDLNLLGIAVAIVEKMRDEEESFDVDNLQWIGICHDLVENQREVMIEYLRYTVLISRKYLTLGDLDRVKKMIDQITPQCVNEVDGELPTLVREFVCYREYLEAEDSLVKWKQAKTQKPSFDDFTENVVYNHAERLLRERKKQEFEVLESKWQKAVEFHGKTAIDKFMKILEFPGGWLRDCCNPLDEDETVHINAVRRIIIKKITFILLNLVRERQSAQTFREFIYVLCEEHRKILEEFSPSEIGSIFRVVEEFTRTSCPNLMVLPK